MDYQVLLFYKYTTIENPAQLVSDFRAMCERYGLKGRVLIAEEGINATLEGSTSNTEQFVAEFLRDPRFADVSIKRSVGTGASFPKLSVKLRKEIVGTQFPSEVDPRVRTATRLKPEDLKQLYEQGEDFVVVDMRNDYEYASGHFKNSINPALENSRDLPKAIEKLKPIKDKKVVTVCTGGIRCEKMSAYLLHQGFENVYQLEDGIHGYMEKYPGQDYLGALYTFDQRVTMHFGGEREIVGKCRLCESPTERYTNCLNNSCHLHFLVCESCTNTEGKAYCSEQCQSITATAQ